MSLNMDDDDMPELEEERDEDDFIEMETEVQDILCLYCDVKFTGFSAVFGHLSEAHDFNLGRLHAGAKLGTYGYIKLINYIRKTGALAKDIEEELETSESVSWLSDSYLQPALDDDAMLQFDIEEDLDVMVAPSEETNGYVTEKDGLREKLKQSEKKINDLEQRLQDTLDIVRKLRESAHVVLTEQPQVAPSDRAVAALTPGQDSAYSDSYSHYGIHQEMLQDEVRTVSYKQAITNNPDTFKDKIVLDLGCGTGILSMFAAQAGAAHVYAVDMSDIVPTAMDIVRENGLEDKITVIKGKMEDIDLPVDKVDVVVSEWMGYALLYESMLDSVLWVRDRLLREGGLLLPSSATLYVTGQYDESLRQKHVSYWSDVYGTRMSAMRTHVLGEGHVLYANEERQVTKPAVLRTFDINTMTTKDVEFHTEVTLEHGDGVCDVDSLVIYFDVDFGGMANKVSFSTGPCSKRTHWKQTVLFLPEVYSLAPGTTMKFSCRKVRGDPRSLKLTVSLPGLSPVHFLME